MGPSFTFRGLRDPGAADPQIHRLLGCQIHGKRPVTLSITHISAGGWQSAIELGDSASTEVLTGWGDTVANCGYEETAGFGMCAVRPLDRQGTGKLQLP